MTLTVGTRPLAPRFPRVADPVSPDVPPAYAGRYRLAIRAPARYTRGPRRILARLRGSSVLKRQPSSRDMREIPQRTRREYAEGVHAADGEAPFMS